LLITGGTITSGICRTVVVVGWYWISSNTGVRKIAAADLIVSLSGFMISPPSGA